MKPPPYISIEPHICASKAETSALRNDIARLEGFIDSLTTSKASTHELNLMGQGITALTHRFETYEHDLNKLSERFDAVMNTPLHVDPTSVLPLLEPIYERLRWLEACDGKANSPEEAHP